MKTDIPWFNSYLIYDGRGTELRLLSSQPVKGPADKAHGIPVREIVVPEPDLNKEDAMTDEKKAPEEKVATEKADEIKAPVSEICGNAEELAASLVDDDSEVKPVEGFFLTSQRWH